MKQGVVLAILLAIMGATPCALGASPATGKTKAPQITAQDLAACKNEIAEFHRREISYLKNDALDYCTKGKDTHYDPDNCRMANEWVKQSSNTGDLAWFMKGNDSCDASDYTCFGISIFNDGMDEETARDLARHPLPPTAKSESGEPWDYSGFGGYYLVVHGCIARLYVAKLDAKKPASSTKPSPAKGTTATAAAPVSSPDPSLAPGKLSQQQVAACSEEIRRKQLESQSWPGDANIVAARLGQLQKDLFEGRCAGHPEAQAYLAGANKMLGYGGNAPGAAGGSLPALASRGGSSGSGAPDPRRSHKIHNPAADAKGCTQLIQGKERGPLSPIGGNLTFVNNCPTAVEFFWCSDKECTRNSGNTWTIGIGSSWPVDGINVRWGACRGANSGGFDEDSQGQRYTCPNLTW
jgi:hypothetical protein